MADDEFIQEIKAAQVAPKDEYLLWAEVGPEASEVALVTVKMPLGFSTEVSLDRARSEARKALATAGIIGNAADDAVLHLDPLPTAEEMTAILDRMVAAGEDMTLVDFTSWETCRVRLHLTPQRNEADNDEELDYKGLKIRRGVAG